MTQHCRHCLGDCGGQCLLPGQEDGQQGLCIHQPIRRLTMRERVLLLSDRRFWRRFFWGIR